MHKFTLIELDSLRAEMMFAMLNAEGRQHVGCYSIEPRTWAIKDAAHDQNYDNLRAAKNNPDKPYCFMGPGIEDSYFGTVMELASIILWICRDGYLSEHCVAKGDTGANQAEALQQHSSYPFFPLEITL